MRGDGGFKIAAAGRAVRGDVVARGIVRGFEVCVENAVARETDRGLVVSIVAMGVAGGSEEGNALYC